MAQWRRQLWGTLQTLQLATAVTELKHMQLSQPIPRLDSAWVLTQTAHAISTECIASCAVQKSPEDRCGVGQQPIWYGSI